MLLLSNLNCYLKWIMLNLEIKSNALIEIAKLAVQRKTGATRFKIYYGRFIN